MDNLTVGCSVKLKPGRYDISPYDPLDTIGRVKSVYGGGLFKFKVVWSNGFSNMYKVGDLELEKGDSKRTNIKLYPVDIEEMYGIEIERTNCCGILEMYGLPENPYAAIVKLTNEEHRNMVIFHDVVGNGNGTGIVKIIRKHRLGKIQSSKIVTNPGSGNDIQMWILYPDYDAINKFVVERIDLA